MLQEHWQKGRRESKGFEDNGQVLLKNLGISHAFHVTSVREWSISHAYRADKRWFIFDDTLRTYSSRGF